MADQEIALGIKPMQIDVATPLLQAAKIRQSQMDQQQQGIAMQRDAIGAEARGLAPYVGQPDYADRVQGAKQRLMQQGIINSPQAESGFDRDFSSPIGIQSIIARTNSPQLNFQQQEAQRQQGNADRTFAESQREFNVSAEGGKVPAGFRKTDTGLEPIPGGPQDPTFAERFAAASQKPVALAPGGMLVKPQSGDVVASNRGGQFDSDTLDQMADQYLSGDKSVFQNLGRGAQAAENIVALRQRVQEHAKAQGMAPAQIALKMQEFAGLGAAQRTLGNRSANIEMAVNEAIQLAPVALKASAAVDRTRFPTINSLILAGEKGTGDENTVRLGIAVNSLINVYSRAINPTGVPTVEDKRHARELLDASWSKGQFQAGVEQLMTEMRAAQQSPDITKRAIGASFTGTTQQAIPQPAIDMLKADPSKAEQFDQIFGTGAAARTLGVIK